MSQDGQIPPRENRQSQPNQQGLVVPFSQGSSSLPLVFANQPHQQGLVGAVVPHGTTQQGLVGAGAQGITSLPDFQSQNRQNLVLSSFQGSSGLPQNFSGQLHQQSLVGPIPPIGIGQQGLAGAGPQGSSGLPPLVIPNQQGLVVSSLQASVV